MNDIIYGVFYEGSDAPVEDEFGNQGFESFCDALEFAKAHLEDRPSIVELVAGHADTGEINSLSDPETIWDYTFTPEQEKELIDSSKCNTCFDDECIDSENFDDYYVDFPEEFPEEDYPERGRAQKFID